MDLSRIEWRTSSYSSSNGGQCVASRHRPAVRGCARLEKPRRTRPGFHRRRLAGVPRAHQGRTSRPGLSPAHPGRPRPQGRLRAPQMPASRPPRNPGVCSPAPHRPVSPPARVPFPASPNPGCPRYAHAVPVPRCPACLYHHLPEPFPTSVSASPWGGQRSGTAEADPRRGSPHAGGTYGCARARTVAARRTWWVCGRCAVVVGGRGPVVRVSCQCPTAVFWRRCLRARTSHGVAALSRSWIKRRRRLGSALRGPPSGAGHTARHH